METGERSGTHRLAAVIGIILVLVVAPLAAEWLTPSANLAPWRLGGAALTLVPDDGGSSDRGSLSGAPSPDSPVSLPDPWNRKHPGFGGTGHYRFTIRVEPDALADRALYVPRLSNHGAIEINGAPLTEPGGIGNAAWHWNRPFYLAIPADNLHAGDNSIVISVTGLANSRAGLSDIYVGPRELLGDAYRLRWFFQVDLLWIANLTVVILAVPLLFNWLRDPVGSANYGLFGAGSILFGLRNFHGVFDFLPLPVAYWWPLVSASLGWSLCFIFVFLLRLCDYRWRAFEIALAVFATAGSIMLFAVPTAHFMALAPWLWYIPLFVVGLFCVGVFAYGTFARPTLHRVVLLVGVLGQIGPAVHDILWIQGTGSFSSVLWMALSFPLVLIITSVLLADDMAKTRAALGNMNKLLEARVAAARRDLEAMYESRRATEREAIGTQERMRLMRDMHDGVGTRLSLLLSGLTRGEIAAGEVEDAVRGSLEELHLLLDARGPSTATLADALANLRYRLDPRLAATGVETRWELGPGVEDIVLSAEATLHVLRIVQECITNAVRHGQARVVTFRIERSGAALQPDSAAGTTPSFVILVIDDGVGIDNASALTRGGGRGLANMRARSEALGGTFTLHSDATGTVARLAL
ncbi:ATP-binding protein [Mesorhizobium sp. CN5-321]|uniref:sensor histidine kinase n=1 Tax=Mesorhizobium hunchu TaxID=3157708 RepID=UPI0032B80511